MLCRLFMRYFVGVPLGIIGAPIIIGRILARKGKVNAEAWFKRNRADDDRDTITIRVLDVQIESLRRQRKNVVTSRIARYWFAGSK